MFLFILCCQRSAKRTRFITPPNAQIREAPSISEVSASPVLSVAGAVVACGAGVAAPQSVVAGSTCAIRLGTVATQATTPEFGDGAVQGGERDTARCSKTCWFWEEIVTASSCARRVHACRISMQGELSKQQAPAVAHQALRQVALPACAWSVRQSLTPAVR